ncbi:lipopolysaccharide assembly protein LapA domain-containing protein [Azohydromonas sediminis]|uniref:lipopolysaccharide assembly protein LapA domain-containing protein n=1 Tax=Azohydromonas sediminis TaxID=2259674 RepID=UPI000E6547A7|nr:lipopolysaccharide assembly protein LapA domain-containing protein [Azohydromonas sediminis]
MNVRYVRPAVLLLLVAALLTVIVQNRAPVQTHFLLVTVEMPHILLLALTALGGFVAGMLVSALRRRRVWPRPHTDAAARDA